LPSPNVFAAIAAPQHLPDHVIEQASAPAINSAH
jgi:hypothetical protein